MKERVRVKCPVPECGKIVGNLTMHMRASHPDWEGNPAIIKKSAEFLPPDHTSVTPPDHTSADPPDNSSKQDINASLVQVISQLNQQMQEQGAVIVSLQQKLQQQEKDNQDFQQSVVTQFNKIPEVVQLSLKSQIDQLAAEYQGNATGAAPAGQPMVQQVTPGTGKDAMLAQLLPVILQNLLGGGGNQQGLGGLEALAKQIGALGQINQALNAPLYTGIDLASKMFTAAVRGGADPQDAANSLNKLIPGQQEPPK